jgi:PAS domain S-box-containing protein
VTVPTSDAGTGTGSTSVDFQPGRAFATLLGNLPGMVYRCRNDPAWTMEFVSYATLELTGYEPTALIESRELAYADLVHREDRDRVWNEVQRALEARMPFQLDYRITTKDGGLKWVWEQGCGVFDAAGQVVALEGYICDVTRYRELEQRLLQAAKLEAVGRLAGGIAHDFNNLLCVVLVSSELMLASVPDADPLRPELGHVRDAAERAAALTRQLLAYSRRQVLQPEPTDLGEALRNIEPLLRRLIGEDIGLEVRATQEPCVILADRSQLEQVVMNLAVNARDAMPGGGRLILETASVDLDAAYVAAHPETTPGPHAMLAVSDTGAGMPPEVMERIFEPFFSTKEIGQGTGLGLATIYGIVKQSGGHVWAYSEVGKGTTFKLYFPRHLGEVSTPSRTRSPERGAGRGEGVLLVEDDSAVRKTVHTVLALAGYVVHEAANAADAMNIARTPGLALGLLLTDVVLPGANGRALAAELAGLFPGLPTVFMSGYTENAIAHHGVIDAGVCFIEKPFTPAALLAKIRDAIDGAPR